MKEATGKISYASRSKTAIIYVPADIVKDSAFPFKAGEKVKIHIEGNKLVIEKL